MSDSNLPEGTAGDAALSFDEGVDALTDLVGPDDDLDPGTEEVESNEAETDDAEADEGDEPEAGDAETDEAGEDELDDAEDETEDDDNGPDGFADEDALVQMADGRTIPVKELRNFADTRVKEIQAQATRKNQEVSEKSKRVDEAAQTLAGYRDFLLRVYEQNQPQEPAISMVDPNSPDYDPIRYNYEQAIYTQRKREWDGLQQMAAAEKQRVEQETTAERQQRLGEEQQRMLMIEPRLKEQKFKQDFINNATDYLSKQYGAPPEVLGKMDAAWQLGVLRDAMEYRKLKEQAPKAKKTVEAKPQMLKGSKRSSPKAKTSRDAQARAAQLAKSGSMEAGVASLMDIDDL